MRTVGGSSARQQARLLAFADLLQDFVGHLRAHRSGPSPALTAAEARRIRRDFERLMHGTDPDIIRVFGDVIQVAVAQLPPKAAATRKKLHEVS